MLKKFRRPVVSNPYNCDHNHGACTAKQRRRRNWQNTQEDVLSPNESQAIRGRFIEVWARGANRISPGTKKFFAKNVFHTKATPFMRAEPFLGKFLGEGP